MTEASTPSRVFISYSHKNLKQFQRLQMFLGPYALNKEISVWTDKDIEAGQDWESEIGCAIQTTDVAILLVSIEFLTSEYIRDTELPLLIESASKGQLRLIPVVLNACDYRGSPLHRFQAVNDTSRPMSKLSTPQRDELWLTVAKTVRETVQRPSPVQGNEIHLREMRETDLEQLMHRYFAKVYGEGLSVNPEFGEANYRADFMLLNPDPIWGGKVVIELKRHSPNGVIPASEVAKVAQRVAVTASVQGVIVTTGRFSHEAMDLAQSLRVRLIDGELLVELLRQQGFNPTLA